MTTHDVQHDSIAEQVGTAIGGLLIDPETDAEKRRLGFGFWVCVFWLVVVALAAILAPWLPLKDPDQSYIQPGERPPYAPSATFWFGTDQDAGTSSAG